MITKKHTLCVNLGLAAVGSLTALWFLLRSSQMDVMALVFGAWIVSPFVLVAILSFFFRANLFSSSFLTFALVLLISLNLYGYWSATSDAQGGLILLVLPFYQILGVFVAALLASIVFLMMRKRLPS